MNGQQTEEDEISQYCTRGLQTVNTALQADENGRINEAISLYVKAMDSLQKGIALCSNNINATVDVKTMETKMKVSLEHVQDRLYALNTKQNMADAEPPATAPQYSESLPKGHHSLQNDGTGGHEYHNKVELLKIPDGVQMYFVTSTDQVSTMPPSYPTSLSVFYVEDDQVTAEPSSVVTCPRVVLQVGGEHGWTYELKSNESPVLRTATGTYVFPCSATGSYIAAGVIFSETVPVIYVETFDNILENMSAFERKKEVEKEDQISDKISYGIKKGAEYVGYGLAKGAEASNYLIKKGSEQIKQNITPNEEPTKVHPNVERGLYYTKQATEATVKASKFLVEGLYTLTSKAGTYIAPYAKQAGEKIFPPSEDGKTNGNIEATAKVVDAGVTAFGSLWNDLEKAGLAIAESISGATVDTVQLKYGPEAGQATSTAMSSGVNIGKTAFNINHLGIKAIMKRAAKDTSKAVIEEFKPNEDNQKTSEKVPYTETRQEKE